MYATKQHPASMTATNLGGDVVSIASSDSDSDCRVVKVVPSPAKLGNNKSKWQNQNSTKSQGARTHRRGREMAMRLLNDAIYEDRPSMSSASRGYGERLSAGLMTAHCSLRGLDSKADDLLETRPNNASTFTRTSSVAVQHVDLEDPLSVQKYTACSKVTCTLSPCLTQGVESEQQESEDRYKNEDTDEGQHEDKQRSTRSRSASTATLDFSPERRSYEGSRRDAREIADLFDEPFESEELVDTRGCMTLEGHAIEEMSRCRDYPTPTDERSDLESQDEEDFCKMDPSPEPTIVLQSNTTLLQDSRSLSPQPRKDAPLRLPPRLSRARILTWDSIVNVAAFETLPGPLFTRPKQRIDTVKYEVAVEEKAAKEAKET